MRSLCLAAVLFGCRGAALQPKDFDPSEGDKAGLSLDDDVDEDGVDRRSYALLEVVSALMVDPSPLGNKEEATVTSTVKHVSWERDGHAVTWHETLCDITATEIFNTRTVFPDALIRRFPEQTREATLSDAVTGAGFTAGPVATLMGVTLDNPLSDPLPRRADHPAVFDQDGDGQPGITVRVEQSLLGTARVYVAQREVHLYDGVVVARDRVEGRITNRGQQNILGASAWWAETPTQRRPDPDPEHSWFVFQEVDDAADCDEILRDHSLFD